jgi:hypothetical protein
MKSLLVALAVAAPLGLAMAVAPASATPLGAAAALAHAAPDAAVRKAHWRGYRHCHGSRRGRWCHGGYRAPRRCVRVPVRVCRYGRGCWTRVELRCRRW